MHKTMASVVSLEKIEIIRSQEFMPSEARLKFLKKMIILGPKTATGQCTPPPMENHNWVIYPPPLPYLLPDVLALA